MKLYLGLLEGSRPHETRVFLQTGRHFIDLNLACAAYLARSKTDRACAYELAEFYFPGNIAAFLERGEPAQRMLDQVSAFAESSSHTELRGPNGEKVLYLPEEIQRLAPLQNSEKSLVIGFSDKARAGAVPQAEIPTAYYKLPQTFVPDGAPVVWPPFSQEIDADACLAVVIGKAGKRISPEDAWSHVAGVTLMIDITARDINRREGLTTNNLLGKNFPSSTCLGPAILLRGSRKFVESVEVELRVDGEKRQSFSLRDCVFTVEQIIAHWSVLGVKPGDWLAIGASMSLEHDRLQNPVPLRLGATIRCSSPSIGELVHRVENCDTARP